MPDMNENAETQQEYLGKARTDNTKTLYNALNKIAELEAQIEKMKCWCNCKNYISCLEDCCRKNISFSKGICYNCKKWEIKEK